VCTAVADFHVNYNSVKCEPLTTFVYQINQTVIPSSGRGGVTGSGGGEGSAGGLQRRATTPHDGGKLDGVCASVQAFDEGSDDCLRESSLLFLLLMLGTVWLGLSLYNFTKTSVACFIATSCCTVASLSLIVVGENDD